MMLGALFVLSSLAFVGCYKHSYNVGSGGNLNSEPKYSHWESHWFFGLIGESNVDVRHLCPSGNATLKDEHTFLNSLVGAFTGIVWYPTTVEVYCGEGGKAATLRLTPEEVRRIALSPETLEWARHVSQVKAAELAKAAAIYRETHKNVALDSPTGTY
jgi:hypothetical protein